MTSKLHKSGICPPHAPGLDNSDILRISTEWFKVYRIDLLFSMSINFSNVESESGLGLALEPNTGSEANAKLPLRIDINDDKLPFSPVFLHFFYTLDEQMLEMMKMLREDCVQETGVDVATLALIRTSSCRGQRRQRPRGRSAPAVPSPLPPVSKLADLPPFTRNTIIRHDTAWLESGKVVWLSKGSRCDPFGLWVIRNNSPGEYFVSCASHVLRSRAVGSLLAL
ncbi:hypothetical protein EVAR_69928_1 [Eumeta japonica]|uniref:Uncharacterized protein n=1 Tax=Eumeta variegata TaxID=151549 RepID=A0A4C2A2X6_EUMVA|nr:hypothetical protein EVAR_69928_1 [Eumeta japonica]